jgi:hypothetical protein
MALKIGSSASLNEAAAADGIQNRFNSTKLQLYWSRTLKRFTVRSFTLLSQHFKRQEYVSIYTSSGSAFCMRGRAWYGAKLQSISHSARFRNIRTFSERKLSV